MDEDDYSRDLFWHALNYRGARLPEAAEIAWRELEACVERLIQDALTKAKELQR